MPYFDGSDAGNLRAVKNLYAVRDSGMSMVAAELIDE
jgi:hypothetical protein